MNRMANSFKVAPVVVEGDDGLFRIKATTTLTIKAPKIGKASTKTKFEKVKK